MNPSEQPESVPGDADPGALGRAEMDGLRTHRPLGVIVISVVVALESLGLAAAGVWFCIGAFTQESVSVASTVFLIVLTFAVAAGLAAVAINAYKGFRWTRSATFVWQLLMVALAIPALLSGATFIGLVLLLPALVAVYYLFTPTVVAFSLRTGGETTVL